MGRSKSGQAIRRTKIRQAQRRRLKRQKAARAAK